MSPCTILAPIPTPQEMAGATPVSHNQPFVSLSRQFTLWQTLMIAASSGDDQAYSRLVRELALWLGVYYRRRLVPTAAEDATQEVMLAIHLKRAAFDPLTPFGPWVAKVARYKWLDRLRQQHRDRALPLPNDVSEGDHGASTRSKILVDTTLGRLKPSQAKVIRLVKIHGASVEEASRATGQSVSLVKVNIHRGLKQMAAYLDCRRSA